MSSRLARQVFSFVERVRAEPSVSVGPELDRLKAMAEVEHGDQTVALVSPIANITWMSRAVLTTTQEGTPQDTIEIPYACTIVGVKASLVEAANTGTLAPISAIDVFLQLDYHEQLTAASDRVRTQQQDPYVVSLESLDSSIANRLLRLELGNGASNRISLRYRWAVPLTVVVARGWCDTQISLNWFIDPRKSGVGGARF